MRWFLKVILALPRFLVDRVIERDCSAVAEAGRLTEVAIVSVNASDIAFVTCTRVPTAHQASVSISAPSSTTGRTKDVDMSTNQSIRQVNRLNYSTMRAALTVTTTQHSR